MSPTAPPSRAFLAIRPTPRMDSARSGITWWKWWSASHSGRGGRRDAPRTCVTDERHSHRHPPHQRRRAGIESVAGDASGARGSSCDSYAGLAALIERTQAEIVYSVRFDGTPRFPRSALLESPTVKWVSVGGTGTDHLGPWNPDKVTVTNAAGVAADMMAEYVLGAMLSFSLGLRSFAAHQRARQWIAGSVEPIQGKTLLLLGLGGTGQALARPRQGHGHDAHSAYVHGRSPTEHVDEVHGVDALPDFGAAPTSSPVACRCSMRRAAWSAPRPSPR